jgi:hypothetical protein
MLFLAGKKLATFDGIYSQDVFVAMSSSKQRRVVNGGSHRRSSEGIFI